MWSIWRTYLGSNVHDDLNGQVYEWAVLLLFLFFPWRGYIALSVTEKIGEWERGGIWIHLAKRNAINKMKCREQNVDTPSLTLDHIALYNVYMFSKIAPTPFVLISGHLGSFDP